MIGETKRYLSSKTKGLVQTIVHVCTILGIINIILISYLLLWWQWETIAKCLIRENGVKWYQPFEALVTGGAAIVALVAFIFDIRKRNRERVQERMCHEREAKKLQMALFSQTLNSWMEQLNSFTASQDAVSFHGTQGIEAIRKHLYYPFRERERIAMENNDTAEMKKIDKEFMRKCSVLNIEPMAQHLWSTINWVLYQHLLCNAFVDEENTGDSEDASVRDAFLKIFTESVILSPQMKWVFGKYRHLRYGLNAAKVSDPSYRGVDYADQILLYRPTLNLLPDGKKKENLISRSKKLEAEEFEDWEGMEHV